MCSYHNAIPAFCMCVMKDQTLTPAVLGNLFFLCKKSRATLHSQAYIFTSLSSAKPVANWEECGKSNTSAFHCGGLLYKNLFSQHFNVFPHSVEGGLDQSTASG